MAWFRKETSAAEPVRNDKVRGLLKAILEETDAADRLESDNPRHVAQFDQAKTKRDAVAGTCTPAEIQAAHEAAQRHGY